jgi:hypothetical protein
MGREGLFRCYLDGARMNSQGEWPAGLCAHYLHDVHSNVLSPCFAAMVCISYRSGGSFMA